MSAETPPTPASQDGGPLLVPARKAAQLLSVSERTLWTLTKRGEVPHIKIGRRTLYDPQSLRDWIASRTEGQR